MKKLNLIQLAENELLNIKGGEPGGGGSTGCSCDSCSCDCGQGDNTAPRGNFSSNSSAASSVNTSIIK